MNTQHKFPIIINGEFITLARLRPDDAEFVYALRTSEAARWLNCPADYSVESQRAWQAARPVTEANYIIYDVGTRVGMISIYETDWVNGVTNAGRLLLAERYVHAHTPYGLEALKLIYDYVFRVMHMRKIAGIINTRNQSIYKLQLYLGMTQEGLFKRHIMLHGVTQDMYFLSLFAEEFPGYEIKLNKLLDKYR